MTPGRHNIVCVDQAFTGRDPCGVVVVAHEAGLWRPTEGVRGENIVRCYEAHSWKADRSPREIARRILDEVCARYGTTEAYVDQHEASSWKQLAADVGLKIIVHDWTGNGTAGVPGDGSSPDERATMSKTQRYKLVRTAMLTGRIRLPNDPTLLRELRAVYSEITASGNEVVKSPRTKEGHGDTASAFVMGASIALTRTPHRTDEQPWERWNREHAIEIRFYGEPARGPHDYSGGIQRGASLVRRIGG
jgi:hypothetical protein